MRNGFLVHHAGNVPRVNKVCFCFPFFPFLDLTSTVFVLVVLCSSLAAVPAFPLVQADPAGTLPPTIFFNDWLPLMAVFCFAVLEAGSSGNRTLDKGTRRPFVCTSPLPIERIPEAALDDQGVFLGTGITVGSAGCNAEKRSGRSRPAY